MRLLATVRQKEHKKTQKRESIKRQDSTQQKYLDTGGTWCRTQVLRPDAPFGLNFSPGGVDYNNALFRGCRSDVLIRL